MLEGYANVANVEGVRRAFAPDCVVKAIGTQDESLTEGKGWAAKQIVERAKIFETYLAGRE